MQITQQCQISDIQESMGLTNNQDGESNIYRILLETPLVKCPLGRLSGRWEDNIAMDVMEMGYEDWSEVPIRMKAI